MSSSQPPTSSSAASGQPQQTSATVLSGAAASQLIARLREAQQQNGGVGNIVSGANAGTIKIQAVQTNPQTGVRQIIAIPINAVQAASSAGATLGSGNVGIFSTAAIGGGAQQRINVSPMGVKTTANSNQGHGQQQQQQQHVRVVKLASAGSLMTSKALSSGAVTVGNTVVTTSGGFQHAQVLTPLKQEPSSGLSSPMTLSAAELTSSGRKRADIDFGSFSDPKRRKTEKGGKGLRHFSMKVCEKVQAKGSTSYNEVADELVAELTDPRCTSPTDQQYDQKNIRRRVYDALNVLMAMNIISKEKKEIRWLGLPTNSVQEANNLELDKAKRMERIKAKTQQLQDLILQQIAFKNLVERNKEREKVEGGPPAPNSAIQLPFIIVNTSKNTEIDCRISDNKDEYLFDFNNTFEIHDDMEVLKRMGLSLGLERGQVSGENLAKAQSMVPKALEQYVTQLAENGPGGNFKEMPQVTDPIVNVLKTPIVEKAASDLHTDDLDDDESDVDIN